MYLDFFNNYYQKNKGLIIGNAILTISIFPIEIILLSWLSGMIFVSVKDKKSKKFLMYVFCFFLVFIIIIILYYYSERLDAIILPTLQSSVRSDIYHLINDKKIGITNIDSGEFITKMLKIPAYIFQNFMNTVSFIIPFAFSILFFIIYMFFIDWRIGIVSIVFFSLFIGLYLYNFNYLCSFCNHRFQNENIIMNEFEDILKNNENILLNNTIEFENQLLFTKEKYLQKSLNKELNYINHTKLFFIIALCVFMLAIIFYSSYLVFKDQLPLFKMIILITAVLLMVRSFTNLIRRCTDSIIEIGPTLKDDKFYNTILASKIHYGSQKDFFVHYDIQLKNVTFSINNQVILNGINLDIPFKSNILITGEIGAGKSTLIKLLCGYFLPTSGKILFDGVDIRQVDIVYFRNHVTLMHQNITLFKRSVLENIIYGVAKNSQQWFDDMNRLKEMQIYHYIKRFILLPDATKLSGGQKQIVLLLRCYFKNTKILILDEPTANLDPETKKIVIEILLLLKKDRTIICVSHDKTIWNLFAKHYFLEKGVLKENEKKSHAFLECADGGK